MNYRKPPSANTTLRQILVGGLSLVMHLLIIVTLVAQAEPEAVKPRTVVMVSMVEMAKPAPKLLAQPEPKPKPEPKPRLKPKPNLKPESQVQTEAPEPEPVAENEPVENTGSLLPQETLDDIELPQFQADYLQNPPPVYPRLSQRLKEQGEVLLKVQVGVDGEPLEINLQQSSGYARLDQAAQKAVTQWRFEPAQSNGKPVIAWVVVPFEFALGG